LTGLAHAPSGTPSRNESEGLCARFSSCLLGPPAPPPFLVLDACMACAPRTHIRCGDSAFRIGWTKLRTGALLCRNSLPTCLETSRPLRDHRH
jgi:hypothetical protein